MGIGVFVFLCLQICKYQGSFMVLTGLCIPVGACQLQQGINGRKEIPWWLPPTVWINKGATAFKVFLQKRNLGLGSFKKDCFSSPKTCSIAVRHSEIPAVIFADSEAGI